MNVLLAFMSILHVCASSCGGQKALGSLEEELQAVVSHCMSAGNRTCVLCIFWLFNRVVFSFLFFFFHLLN